jgi:hypothetical protein
LGFHPKLSYGVLKSGQPFDVNDDGVWGETPRATLLPKSQFPIVLFFGIAKWVKSGFQMIVPIYAKVSMNIKLKKR